MKKYYLLLLFVTSFMGAQIVNIPDANFKAKLLGASTSNYVASTYHDFNNFNTIPTNFVKIDTNNDGEIQYSEVQNIQYLEINSSDIYDLTGIEAFVNLKALYANFNHLGNISFSQNLALRELYLDQSQVSSLNIAANINLRSLFCRNNQLNTLNVSPNVNLVKLYVDSNELTSLNVTQNTFLENLSVQNNAGITVMNVSQNILLRSLICSGTNISTLDVTVHPYLDYLTIGSEFINTIDVSQNPNLKVLVCNNSNLTSLNISSNPILEELYIAYTQISTIDLTQKFNLKRFDCSSSQITTLDLSSNLNLEFLSCQFNNLTSLDLSNNTNLTSLYCGGNQLEYLNIKNGSTETGFILNNNPLQFICADESQINSLESELNLLGMNSTVVNSYCSFTPGGNYNTISGSMIFDSNNNGCDASDLPQPNIKVSINDGTNSGATFTNNSGDYSFLTQTGEFELTPNIENPSYFNFSPNSAIIPFTNNANNVSTQNFCITPNGIHPDLEVVIVPVIPARPGFDAVYKIVYKNKGNQTVDASINFTFNDALLDFVSASVVPTNILSSTMNWTVPNIGPFQSGSILVTFNVNSPQDTPAVNIGDILAFNAFIDVTADDTWADNTFDFNQTVVGSYDPNDITCLQGNSLPLNAIGKYMHYNIRFENTGTAPAENIVVKNVIDLTQYNIQSLQVMESSHPVTVKVTGNIAEFIFQGIDLDTGGHGNILLKLKSNATLSNDFVINSADIFFDYNFPIVTNDEQTVFADLSKNDFKKDVSIQVYPNPAESEIHIKAENTINSIQLFDVQGRLLVTKMSNEYAQTIDLSNYASGIYFITISTSVGKQTQKIIKK